MNETTGRLDPDLERLVDILASPTPAKIKDYDDILSLGDGAELFDLFAIGGEDGIHEIIEPRPGGEVHFKVNLTEKGRRHYEGRSKH